MESIGYLTKWEIVFSDYKGISIGYVNADSKEDAGKIFNKTHPNLHIIDIRVCYTNH